jgi:uncharacterized protein DUF4331
VKRKLILALFSLMAVFALMLGMGPGRTQASSHREAPLISLDPAADNTDLYFFRTPSPDPIIADTVTIVANYIPLEEPNGGPNFNSFGDDVRYEIKVDNNGDGEEDITYRFRFKTKNLAPNSFLYAGPQVASGDDPNLFVQQTFTVDRVTDGDADQIARGNVPPANVGPRTIKTSGADSAAAYEEVARKSIVTLNNGTKIFAGPRDDPFFVDLGAIFDLGGLRPFNNLHLIPRAAGAGIDGVSGYNTHSIIMQIPIKLLTKDHKGPSDTKQPVLGVYASASRQTTRVLRSNGTVSNSGPWQQVSRLGYPLINEVIIPRGMKDLWNSTDPADDKQFEKFYLNSELAGIVNLLYGKQNPNGALEAADTTGRADLSLILLQGVPGVNNPGKGAKADLLRLNVSIPATIPVGQGNPLTVINDDPAKIELGFPNGRRLEDDIVDVELRAVAQGYGGFLAGAFGLPNKSPNNIVGDGVDKNDKLFFTEFPYLATPFAGYDSTLHGGTSNAQ